MLINALHLLPFPALMAFAAWSDLFTMTIPNRVSVVLAAAFLGFGALDGSTVGEIGGHFAAGFVVLVIGFGFFCRGWLGGGDAKFAAASSLWLGWSHVCEYLLYASLLGGVLTLFVLELRKRTLPPALASQTWVMRLHDPAGGIPYGIALAIAALLVYPSTMWVPVAR
jgi:prepilin peptidase CpaA